MNQISVPVKIFAIIGVTIIVLTGFIPASDPQVLQWREMGLTEEEIKFRKTDQFSELQKHLVKEKEKWPDKQKKMLERLKKKSNRIEEGE